MGSETLTIQVTTGHCLGGEGNDVYPGAVLVAPRDLTVEAALLKVRRGYARVIPNLPESTVTPADVVSHGDPVVETGDPVIETRDPIADIPAAAEPRAHKGRPRAGGR